MVIIAPRTVYYMSMIMAVCGMNYCMMAGDRRRVTPDEDNIVPEDESFQKVFKINDHLLFGATGWFYRAEELLDPLAGVDLSTVSIETAVAFVENYMTDNIKRIINLQNRNYILAGREFDGQYCIVSVRYNPNKCSVDEVVYRPDGVAGNIAYTLALPPSMVPVAKEYSDVFGTAIRACKSNDDLSKLMSNCIREVAKHDDTVNSDVDVYMVYS